jgi:hypothetical protein
MSQMKSRRELALLATGGVIAAGVIAGAGPALAERQPTMVRARASLNDALEFLRRAADDKGGHKINAMHLIEQAIAEVNAGIEFANTH